MMKVRCDVRRCLRYSCLAFAIASISGSAEASAQQKGETAAPAVTPASNPVSQPAAAPAAPAPGYRTGGKSIVIPAPEGDLIEIGDDYRVVMDPVVPDTNRLLAAFVLPADAKIIRSGSTAQLEKYALVEVPRRAEFVDVTPDAFKEVTDSVAQQFGGSLDTSLKNQEDEFNRRLKDLNPNAAAVTFDKPVPLGVIFSKPDACAFGMIMLISSKGATVKMIASVGVLRAQDRILFVYIYRKYEGDDTVEWIRAISEQWADAILKANP